MSQLLWKLRQGCDQSGDITIFRSKAINAFILCFLVLGIAWLVLDRYLLVFTEPAAALTYPKKNITLQIPAEGEIQLSLPPVPDLSGYTMDNLIAKIAPLKSGSVRIAAMVENPGFTKFTEIRRQIEFSKLQGRTEPQAILIESGVYDMAGLLKAVGNPNFLSYDGQAYLLKAPLYVAPGASLVIRGSAEQPLILRMSSITGGFLVNAGHMFIVDAEIAGWDDQVNSYSAYERPDKFRPFIATWGGSEAYMGRSSFYDLGYAASKSYGITYSSLKTFDESTPPPHGWIIESRFERLYYGFYCYEAEDVAIINNVYADNIIYGIDPHDRSSRLIIVGNEAYGTQKKHGIIGSREVNDSWFVNNISHHNAGSGIMLDRSSIRNVVNGNKSYKNGADGMTLFESQSNIVTGNILYQNGKNGLRIRNSWDVLARNNIIFLNKGVGVQVYTSDLTLTEDERDFAEDPFTRKAGADINDSFVAFNTSGQFKFNDIDRVRLSDIEFLMFDSKFIRGDLDDANLDIAVGLRRKPRSVEIAKTGPSVEPVSSEEHEEEAP